MADNVESYRAVIVDGRIKTIWIKVCPECESVFETTNLQRKFCTTACCVRTTTTAWRKKNPEVIQHRNRVNHYKMRRRLVDYLGGKCVSCDCQDWWVLQINHIEGGGIAEFRKKNPEKVYREILAGKRIGEFDLRCANCNVLYEYEQRRRWMPEDEYEQSFGIKI